MIRTDFLKGDRLRLTALRKADFEAIQRWNNDLIYRRNVDDETALPTSYQSVERFFGDMLEGKSEKDIMLLMRPLDSDDAFGFVALDGIQWQHGRAMLAIGIGDAAYRGKGYGEEAMRLMLDFAFNEMNLYRIGLTVFEYNTNAIALYERLGFVHEGTMRKSLVRDGRRWDTYMYALLRDEWVG